MAQLRPAICGALPWTASKHRAPVADVGAAGEPDAAADLRRHVAEDVAVQVGRDDHVEALGLVGHEGGADVDDHPLGLDLRVLGRYLAEDLVKTGRP